MDTDLRHTRLKALVATCCIVAAMLWAPTLAANLVDIAKLTVRGDDTKSATNEISVTTSDGTTELKEIARVFILKDADNPTKTRADAITTQMTQVSAMPVAGTGADVIEIKAKSGLKICSVDHNGLNGEEINVNPTELLKAAIDFKLDGGIGTGGIHRVELPQLGIAATVATLGLTATALTSQLFDALTDQGLEGVLSTDGLSFTIDGYLGDTLVIGGGADFDSGLNSQFTDQGYEGVNLDLRFIASVPEPAVAWLLLLALSAWTVTAIGRAHRHRARPGNAPQHPHHLGTRGTHRGLTWANAVDK